MKIKKEKLVDYLTFWLPLKLGTLVGALSIYKTYQHLKLMQMIAAAGARTDAAYLVARTDTLFYALLTVTIVLSILSSIMARAQMHENAKIIARLDWTVERLASLEAQPSTSPVSEHPKWPWGTHHTIALGHLEAAANRFWTNLYDPGDPSTAPKNEMVEDWLIKERQVSKQKAAAIASLLRPDGLKTGPR